MGKDVDFEYGHNDPEWSDKQTRDPDTPWQFDSCTGQIICPKCGKFHGDCFIVTNRMKEDEQMIPQSTQNNQQQGRGGRQTGGRRGGGLDYIKEGDLSHEKQIATITAARLDQPDPFNKQNPQSWVLTVQISINGRLLLWSLRDGNPNLTTLQKAFSSDENKWPGKEIEMYLAQDPVTMRNWFRADPVVNQATTKKGGR